MSKTLHASTILRRKINHRRGARRGSVKKRKFWVADPPSTLAASYSSEGRLCSPARVIRKTNGVHCQMSTRITATRAQEGSESHGMFSPPKARISELDRKSTRLNSSHANISYAVFCLKKKIDNLTPPVTYIL